ncbi:MAG: transglycosylase family protein [Propioniciclava sp.]|nr:transglycosylase family protein [Propioniciclava sp.]
MVSKRLVAGATALAIATWGTIVAGSLAMSQAGATEYPVWDQVAQCESGGNWSINTGNGHYGGVQFSLSTWAAFGGREYAYYPHHASKEQQIAIARRTLAVQGPGAWPTCSVKAGLTKENGGADRDAQPEGDGGSTPAPAPSDELTVNGDLDRPTIIAMQKWVGTTPDGIWGPATTRALQAKVGASVTGYRDRQTTVRVQTVVGATPDGVWGPKTTSALQRFLLDGAGGSEPAPAPAPAPEPAPEPAPSGGLEVNGILDRATTIAMQKWVGTTPDGIWGPATTRALQAKVGVSVDGVRGPETNRGVQRTVGATADGIWGPATTRALQTYLNNLG